MSGYAFAIGLCAVVVTLLFFLLRTRRIREKYAGVWIALTLAVVLLGVFPGVAIWVSDLVGVETPVNLLFALAFVVLLALCIQLSAEVSNLEEETRTLAEEIALLRLDLTSITSPTPDPDRRPAAEGPSAAEAPTDPVPMDES